VPTIDPSIRRSLKAFVEYIRTSGWRGRENEAISLYAFGFLQRERSRRGPLRDPTQIGIEVGAADTPKGKRSQVRKDLVVWRAPAHNRWYPPEPRSEPLVIMEWKVRRTGFRSGSSNDADIRWLTAHCERHPETTGYAVWLDLRGSESPLCLERFSGGSRKRWEL